MLQWRKHAVLQPPTDEEMLLMSPEELANYHRVFHEAIQNSEEDPYHYAFRLPHWDKAEKSLAEVNEILALGGNRSGKSQWAAFSTVKAAMENPRSCIFCFAQNSEVSIRQQQADIWRWLPKELKIKQTGSNTYISYKEKTGFAESSLILPNGSHIIFKTYSQFQNNPTILEGAELGSMNPNWLNIGAVLDEYLIGEDLINTLRFRMLTRNAKMLVTFTPVDGWTPVIKDYLDGAETLETRQAELLDGEIVPYIQRSRNRNAMIHYFHSQDNPFGGYERMKKDLSGRPREEILIRAYGVPTKSFTTKFPKFNKAVNVISPDKIPQEDVTRYLIVDPAGSKNWFMTWIAVDESGSHYVYREWPDVGVGDWAEWRNGKWCLGEGAKGQGYGIRDYVEMIQQLEGNEDVFERLIDPRLGAARHQVADGESSIIQDLEDQGMTFIPAPGIDIDDGLQKLIGLMAWDTTKPMDSLNRPRFYVSTECVNTINALSEYTGEDGKNEAWKDPVDCYDPETEVMTKQGWVKFPELRITDEVATMSPDGFLEWQQPEEVIERPHNGEMVEVHTQHLDFKVTPKHRMVVYPQKSNGKFVFRNAEDLYRQDTIPTITRGLACSDDEPMVELWEGKTVKQADWAEFLGWFVSEGSTTGSRGGNIQIPGRGYSVYISQTAANPQHVDAIKNNLTNLGFTWAYRDKSFVISSKALWTKLKPLGNSEQKHIPQEAFGFSRESAIRMIDAMVAGDGWLANGLRRYASTSKRLISDMQIMMQIAGIPHGMIVHRKLETMNGSEIRGRKVTPRFDQYWLLERKGRKSCITTKDKRFLPSKTAYSGLVYCVSVPNKTLIVRRNGAVMVCGNCLRYASVADLDHVSSAKLRATRQGTGGY